MIPRLGPDLRVRLEAASRPVTLVVLAAGFVVTLAAGLPGQLSYDSIMQLADARSGRYHAWHPPMMAWLMGLGDHALPGTALYVAGVCATLFAALAIAVATARRVGPAAPFAALLFMLTPHIVVWQGIVWKDVLFADALVSGCLLLTAAAPLERNRAARAGLIVAAGALFTVALLVRQNGIVAPVFGAAAIGAVRVSGRPGPRPWRRGAVAAVAAVGVVLAGAGLAQTALSTRLTRDAGPAGQLRLLQMYDLAGIARRTPDLDLTALGDPDLAAHLKGPARAAYTPERVDPFSLDPAVSRAVDGPAPGVAPAWRAAVAQHPGAWLAHRAAVFRWMIAPPDLDRCAPVYTGVDGDPDQMAQLGLVPHVRSQDVRLERYAHGFYGTPLYNHLAYALAALGLLVLFLRSGRVEDRPMAALLAALAYAASFTVIGIACDYRYLYALDLATLATLFHLAVSRGPTIRPGRG